MNRYFLAFLVLATAFEFQARELTPDEALQRVQGASTRMNAPRRIAASAPKLVYTVKSTLDDRDATAYLFANSGKEKGYLLLSAEDTFEPVIGYSNTATITNPDDMPDNLKWWLSEVGREADYAIRHNAVLKAPASLGPAVEPLLKSKWHQDAPFNLYTPIIDGQHAPTGCVATAMAQVMYYHKWPLRPQGSHTYKDAISGVTRSIDFDELQFDWDSMLDRYDSNSSTESRIAVAILMKAIGYGINTYYNKDWSIANYSSEALINYFKYDKKCFILNRNPTSAPHWNNVIYSNLTEGLPVLYDGSDLTVGHAFVCDGYDGNGYFHFNFGWSGACDGYFLLSNLLYSFEPSIVLNMYPDNGHSYKDYSYCVGDIYFFPKLLFTDTFTIGAGIDISIGNILKIPNLEVGLGIRERGAAEIEIIPLCIEIKDYDYFKTMPADNLLAKLDSSKEYELNLFWRNGPHADWVEMWHLDGNSDRYIKRIDDEWRQIEDSKPIDSGFEIFNVRVNANNVIDRVQSNKITFSVLNTTDEKIYANLEFGLSGQTYSGYSLGRYRTVLEPLKKSDHSFEIEDMPEVDGKYKLKIYDPESGVPFYDSGLDSICIVGRVPATSIRFDVTTKEVVVGEELKLTVNILPENATNNHVGWNYDWDMFHYMASDAYSITLKVLKEGESVVKAYTTDGTNLEAECRLTAVSGIEDIVVGDKDERFDIYNLNGVLLHKNAGVEDLRELATGCYIINNRKVYKR